MLYLLYYLFGSNGRLKFRLQHMRIVAPLIKRMLSISVGGIGQFLIATASWIAIVRVIALYGSPAVAAYTIALRMIEFCFLPAWGLGNAAATLVGQNLGAGKPERAEKSVWRAAKYNTMFMSALGLLFVLLAPAIVGIFTSEPEVLHYGTLSLRIMGLGYPAYAVGMIVIQALNGAGDTRTPSLLNFICFWVLQIPLAYWLATSVGWGPTGVFWAIVVGETLLTILGVLVFRHGAWKLNQV